MSYECRMHTKQKTHHVTCIAELELFFHFFTEFLIDLEYYTMGYGRWEYCPEGTFAIGFKLKGLHFEYTRDQVSRHAWDTTLLWKAVFQILLEESEHLQYRWPCQRLKLGTHGSMSCGAPDWIESDGWKTSGRLRWWLWSQEYPNEMFNSACWGHSGRLATIPWNLWPGRQSLQYATGHANDNSGLNNVRFPCCNIPDPGSMFTPDDRWSEIFGCENLSPHEVNCTYECKKGLSRTDTTAVSGFHEFSTLVTVGFSLGASGTYLSTNFDLNLGFSSTTSTNWEPMRQETYFEYTIVRLDFGVPPGMYYVLKQVEAGVCGGFYLGIIKFDFTAHQGGKEIVYKEMTSGQLD